MRGLLMIHSVEQTMKGINKNLRLDMSFDEILETILGSDPEDVEK